MNREHKAGAARGRRSARKDEQVNMSPFVRILRGAGIAVLSSMMIGGVLLLVTSAVVYASDDPDALLIPVSLGVSAVTSLLCGVIAERASGAETLPVGGITGLIWILASFLLSLLVGAGVGALPTVYALAARIPQVLFVLLGAALAKNRPRRVSSRRRY